MFISGISGVDAADGAEHPVGYSPESIVIETEVIGIALVIISVSVFPDGGSTDNYFGKPGRSLGLP